MIDVFVCFATRAACLRSTRVSLFVGFFLSYTACICGALICVVFVLLHTRPALRVRLSAWSVVLYAVCVLSALLCFYYTRCVYMGLVCALVYLCVYFFFLRGLCVCFIGLCICDFCYTLCLHIGACINFVSCAWFFGFWFTHSARNACFGLQMLLFTPSIVCGHRVYCVVLVRMVFVFPVRGACV